MDLDWRGSQACSNLFSSALCRLEVQWVVYLSHSSGRKSLSEDGISLRADPPEAKEPLQQNPSLGCVSLLYICIKIVKESATGRWALTGRWNSSTFRTSSKQASGKDGSPRKVLTWRNGTCTRAGGWLPMSRLPVEDELLHKLLLYLPWVGGALVKKILLLGLSIHKASDNMYSPRNPSLQA